jgi:hypothetical protein
MLPDWSSIDFKENDTIRLHLTRKYTSMDVEQMIMGSGLSIIGRKTTAFGEEYNTKFGIDLILISPRPSNNTASSMEAALNPLSSNEENKNVFTIYNYYAGETHMTENRNIHSNTYNEHIETGGGNYIQGDYVQGDYVNMSQDLTQAATQIQDLIEQLQRNGVTIDVAQSQVANDMATQAQNPTVRNKLARWGQSLGDATVSDVVKSAVKLAIRSAGIPLP